MSLKQSSVRTKWNLILRIYLTQGNPWSRFKLILQRMAVISAIVIASCVWAILLKAYVALSAINRHNLNSGM